MSLVQAFYDPSQLEKNTQHYSLVVTNCGYATTQNKTVKYQAIDDNSDYLLLYMHQGHLKIKINNEYLILGPNHVLFFPPDTLRKYTFMDDEHNERYYVYFKGKQAKKLLETLHLLDSPYFLLTHTTDLPSCFLNIIRDFSIHPFDISIYRTSYLIQLLSSISLQIENSHSLNHSDILVETVQYMKAHINEKLTLDTLGKIANYSASSLNRCFQQEYAMSPINYLIRLRIEESIELMTTTNLSISEIAEMVGFIDTPYFIKTFKKNMGITPSKYKKKCASKYHS